METIKIIKALGDETRIRVLNLLAKRESCVYEIENILGITQSNASRHLDKLKAAGIITFSKKAQWVYYRLNDKILLKYNFLKTLIFDELSKESLLIEDIENLEKYIQSGVKCCEKCED